MRFTASHRDLKSERGDGPCPAVGDCTKCIHTQVEQAEKEARQLASELDGAQRRGAEKMQESEAGQRAVVDAQELKLLRAQRDSFVQSEARVPKAAPAHAVLRKLDSNPPVTGKARISELEESVLAKEAEMWEKERSAALALAEKTQVNTFSGTRA